MAKTESARKRELDTGVRHSSRLLLRLGGSGVLLNLMSTIVGGERAPSLESTDSFQGISQLRSPDLWPRTENPGLTPQRTRLARAAPTWTAVALATVLLGVVTSAPARLTSDPTSAYGGSVERAEAAIRLLDRILSELQSPDPASHSGPRLLSAEHSADRPFDGCR